MTAYQLFQTLQKARRKIMYAHAHPKIALFPFLYDILMTLE